MDSTGLKGKQNVVNILCFYQLSHFVGKQLLNYAKLSYASYVFNVFKLEHQCRGAFRF